MTSQNISSMQSDSSALHPANSAQSVSEAGFRAIVSSTPGLVFQLVRSADDNLAFWYLSEGCHALLGISAEQLREHPQRLLQMVQKPDRASFQEAMRTSAANSKSWNWEGRIRVAQWNDIKWINLRATPRSIDQGSVLWEGIMTNITQSKLEEAEIKHSRAQLAELSAHIDSVKEQERMRIAREIHDDLGGNLTAIKMALALLTRRLPNSAEQAELQEKAAYVEQLVDRTIESIHRIAGDLRPGILDFGLVAAIEWQAREFEKQAGIPCEFSSQKTDIELLPEQATAIFRIFQEALTNISKHANASRVTVRLQPGARQVKLEVKDNGRGIAEPNYGKPNSFGIRGMVERANALGGSLTITNNAAGGCVVALKIPLQSAASSKRSARFSSNRPELE